VLKAVMVAVISEQFLKELLVYILEKLAEKTDNKIDDHMVEMVKKALQPSEAQKSDEQK
jgi:hypothetical protein